MANGATSQSYEGRILFDTLQDALHQERGDIICILWKEREVRRMHTYTSAIIVAPVEEKESIYRRRGWMEIEGDDLFQDDPRNIILV